MGMLHAKNVYKIPRGWVSDSQMLLLLALAERTADDRTKWLHKRSELADALSWSPTKLRRLIADLDQANMISREQRGHFVWIDIRWVEHIAVPGIGDHIRPTDTAFKLTRQHSKRTQNLKRGATQ